MTKRRNVRRRQHNRYFRAMLALTVNRNVQTLVPDCILREDHRRNQRKLRPVVDPQWGDYNPEAILLDPQAPLVHKVYAEVNIGIRDRGEVWEKCANCGCLYQHTPQWSASTVCSPSCFTAFRASLDEF